MAAREFRNLRLLIKESVTLIEPQIQANLAIPENIKYRSRRRGDNKSTKVTWPQ